MGRGPLDQQIFFYISCTCVEAVQYYEKLKPDCVDSGISYSERVKKREVVIVVQSCRAVAGHARIVLKRREALADFFWS